MKVFFEQKQPDGRVRTLVVRDWPCAPAMYDRVRLLKGCRIIVDGLERPNPDDMIGTVSAVTWNGDPEGLYARVLLGWSATIEGRLL
jgi:hypothetical protein